MATLQDQLEAFWASLPPDVAEQARHTCACTCDCGGWTDEPGEPCPRCEAGRHFELPDTTPEEEGRCHR